MQGPHSGEESRWLHIRTIDATGITSLGALATLRSSRFKLVSTRSKMNEIRNAKIFIGYDSREDIAYQVARFSLMRHSKGGLSVHPIRQAILRELGIYRRSVDVAATTEFSLTRFLTPYLAAQNEGWVIFSY
jgi:hypothetical protein